MFTATEYLGPVGIGATTPQLFRGVASQEGYKQKVYVVKFANNRLGSKVLANELLAAEFGQFLNLCFPPGGIIHVPPDIIYRNRRLLGFRVTPGQHFASEYLRGAEYVGRHNLPLANNKAQMAGVMLFDHMFYNLDRTWNRKNLLIRKENAGHKIYAIDNSHLFRRGRWDLDWLEELKYGIIVNYRRSFGLLLKHFLYPEDFFHYAEKIRYIDAWQIDSLVKSIPLQWLPNENERFALKSFIAKRCDMVDEIAYRLAELIPDIHWSSDFD